MVGQQITNIQENKLLNKKWQPNNQANAKLFLIMNISAAISWPPPLISQLFLPRFLGVKHFSQLSCFGIDSEGFHGYIFAS